MSLNGEYLPLFIFVSTLTYKKKSKRKTIKKDTLTTKRMFWRWGRRVARFVGLPGPGRGLGAREPAAMPGDGGLGAAAGCARARMAHGHQVRGHRPASPPPLPRTSRGHGRRALWTPGTRVCSAWFPPWRSSSTGKGTVVAVYRRQRKAAPLSSAAEEVAVEDARVISSETQRTLCFALRFLSTPSHGEGCAVSELPGGGAQDRGLGEGACMYYL